MNTHQAPYTNAHTGIQTDINTSTTTNEAQSYPPSYHSQHNHQYDSQVNNQTDMTNHNTSMSTMPPNTHEPQAPSMSMHFNNTTSSEDSPATYNSQPSTRTQEYNTSPNINNSSHSIHQNNQYAPPNYSQHQQHTQIPPQSPSHTPPPIPPTKSATPGKQNEKFMVLALLSSVIITAVIIGAGWALFSPKAPTPQSVQTLNEESIDNTDISYVNEDITSTTQDDGNLNITYGENTPPTTVKTPEPTPSVQATQTQEPPIKTKTTPSTPLSSNNITKPITKENLTTTTVNPNATKYWIQVFATTNRDKATQIKQDLTTRGITPTIVTKTINNTIYYKLRIGPYFNKAESNKFLSWIKSNTEFDDAYLSASSGS